MHWWRRRGKGVKLRRMGPDGRCSVISGQDLAVVLDVVLLEGLLEGLMEDLMKDHGVIGVLAERSAGSYVAGVDALGLR